MTALTLVVTGCSSGGQSVTVAVARTATVNATPGGVGTVAAAVDVPVTLVFGGIKSPLRVTSVNVVPGQSVAAGDSLLTIDSTPLALSLVSARAALARTQGNLSAAEARLASGRFPSAAARAALQDQVTELQAQVQLSQGLVDIASGRSSNIVAPIAGIVAAVNVNTGIPADPTKPLVELVDTTRLIVSATLPVQQYSQVSLGAPAIVSFNSLPGVTLNGSVTSVSPQTVTNGLGFQVVITANNTPDKKVIPGLQAYVAVSTTQKASVAVPVTAVLNATQDPTVFIVSAGKAQLRHVTVGASDGHIVAILSGLASGDQCVITGAQSLSDGSSVSVSSIQRW